MSEEAQVLRTLMNEHQLTLEAVAKLLNRSKETIKAWLANSNSKKYRKMHPYYLNYFKYKLTSASTQTPINQLYQLSHEIDSAMYHLENGLGWLKDNRLSEAVNNLQTVQETLNNVYFLFNDLALNPNALSKAQLKQIESKKSSLFE